MSILLDIWFNSIHIVLEAIISYWNLMTKWRCVTVISRLLIWRGVCFGLVGKRSFRRNDVPGVSTAWGRGLVDRWVCLKVAKCIRKLTLTESSSWFVYLLWSHKVLYYTIFYISYLICNIHNHIYNNYYTIYLIWINTFGYILFSVRKNIIFIKY